MLKLSAKTGNGTVWVGVASDSRQRRKMVATLALLMLSLALVLVRDHQFWFGANEAPDAAQALPVSTPEAAKPAPPAPPVKVKKHLAARPSESTLVTSAVAANRSALPPLQIQVVSSDTQRTVPAVVPATKIQASASSASGSTTPRGQVTVAAERVRISDQTYALRQPLDATYPLLAQQTRVEGSVVLQVIIAADGVIQSMRVLSGPPILASAAREAVRNWRFKPYLQNGQPVETSATITVNLIIRVLDNTTRNG